MHVGARADIDAIIVPTIWHHTALRYALELSKSLGCQVVALCSRSASARDAAKLAHQLGARLIAVNVTGRTTLPELQTSAMQAQHKLSDLSLKRNLALALARMAGWQRILFLDDDIRDIEPDDVRTAAALLDSHPVVALENAGFPDNSVVCHALRRVQTPLGITQDSFIGGGAMLVAAHRVDSFFPDIYNEDWFFLLGLLERQDGAKRIATVGKVAQLPYDPFLDPFRARIEELGDCLGEGVFSLLDDRAALDMALESDYWKAFLEDRGSLIRRAIDATSVVRLDPRERAKIVESLRAAQGRHRLISPEYCVRYMRAWRADRKTWHRYIGGLSRSHTPTSALAELGLPAYESSRSGFPR
jgi:hypothetical protein